MNIDATISIFILTIVAFTGSYFALRSIGNSVGFSILSAIGVIFATSFIYGGSVLIGLAF